MYRLGLGQRRPPGLIQAEPPGGVHVSNNDQAAHVVRAFYSSLLVEKRRAIYSYLKKKTGAQPVWLSG